MGNRFQCQTVAICAITLFAVLALLPASAAADENSQKMAQAATLIQSGKLDAGEAILWEILRQHPDHAAALNLLGKVRLQEKRFAEAKTLLRRSSSLDPNFLPAYLNLAAVFRVQGETDKEIGVLLDAARSAPADAEVNCALAAAYLEKNDFQKSLEALQRIPASRRPDKALPLLMSSYLGLGSVSEAKALVPVIIARAHKDHALPVQVAEVLLDFDLLNDALAVLQIAEKQPPLSSDFFLARGRAREHKGELVPAQKDFQRAVDLNPKSSNALQALARLLAGEGNWQKSMDVLGRARAVSPDSPEILRKFAAASLHSGHPADAMDAAQQLIKLRPDEPEALYLLGVAQLQQGAAEDARTTLEKYVTLRSSEPLAFLALGMVEVSLRDLPAARINFEQCIKLDPNQVDAYYELGSISKDQGDDGAAIIALEKAISLNPAHARAHALLGQMYLSKRNYSKAQEHLTRAADLAPNVPDTHYQLGLLFARLNQPDRAHREMDQFHKLKQKDSPGPAQPGTESAPSTPPYPPS
jgi:tetratricopeptide (TPR) repeat protein